MRLSLTLEKAKDVVKQIDKTKVRAALSTNVCPLEFHRVFFVLELGSLAEGDASRCQRSRNPARLRQKVCN
jgi:hypothetical protein